MQEESKLELEEDQEVIEQQKSAPIDPKKAEAEKALAGKVNQLTYDGQVGQVYKIWLLNIFMNIITLGIYSFWGKTRLRKYVAGGFQLGGDRFEYTGTGGELFKGFLKAIPIFILVYAPFGVASLIGGEEALWPLLFLLPIFFFFSVAYYAALRYRLSRTRWRGIRGYMDGSALKYGAYAFYHTVLNIITLGIAVPFSDLAKHRYVIMTTYFGNVPVEFEGDAKALLKVHFLTLFLFIPTVGMSRLWYKAAVIRAKMNGLTIGSLNVKNDTTGLDLLKLIFGNLLIMILTLGIGMPVIMQRNMRFFANHNVITGDLNTSEIMQAKDQKISVGEGLDDAFGLDTGLM